MAVAHVRSETRGLGKHAYRSESSRNTRPDRLCSERSSETLIWMGWVGSFVHDKDDGRNRVLNVGLMRVLYGPLHRYGCYVTPIESSLSINVAVKRGWVGEYAGGEVDGGSSIPHSLPVQLDRLDRLLAVSRSEPISRCRLTT